MDYLDWFYTRLTELRTHKGVSARDMSLSLGQSESYINSIEITNSQETEPEPTATPTPGRQPSVTPSQDNNTPGGGTSDNGGTTGRTSVKTGDNTPIGVWAGILAAAVVIGGAAGIEVKRKKKK